MAAVQNVNTIKSKLNPAPTTEAHTCPKCEAIETLTKN